MKKMAIPISEIERKEIVRLIGHNAEVLCSNFTRKASELQEQLEMMKKVLAHCRANGWVNHQKIWNACAQINKVSLDLTNHCIGTLLARNENDRKYHITYAITTVYESMNDVPVTIGKEFREVVAKLENGQILLEQLGESQRSFNESKARLHSNYKTLRNTISSHKDKDLLAQLTFLDNLDWVEKLSELSTYGDCLTKLGPPLEAIMVKSTQNPNALIN